MTILNTIKTALTTTPTSRKIDALTAELEAARLTLAQTEQTVGDRLVEGLDVTAATDTMKQATDQVRILEAALVVAIQKGEAAQAELKQAERQVTIEIEAAACARLNALGPKGEALLAPVNQCAIDVALAADALRVAGGNERYAYSVNEIRGNSNYFWDSPNIR